jgi:PAS domain S-box-containing protein
MTAVPEERAGHDREPERLRTLARLSRLIGSSLDVDEVLAAIARATQALLDVPGVLFWTADEDARTLELRVIHPPEISRVLPRRSITYDEGIAGFVATHRRATQTADVRGDPRVLWPDWCAAHGLTAILVVPIEADGALLGVAALVARAPFAQPDVDLVEILAAQAGVALRNATVFARSERRRAAAEALAEAGRLLSQTLDPDAVARCITDSVGELLDARGVVLYRPAPDGSLVATLVSRSAAPDFTQIPRLAPELGGLSWVALREGRPLATPDMIADPRAGYAAKLRNRLARAEHRGLLAVPLVSGDRRFGVLLVNDRTGRIFTDDEIRLVQTFSDQAVMALENARLFQQASRQAARMRALADVERLLSETLDPDVVTSRIAATLRELLGARVTTVSRPAENGAYVFTAVAGATGPRFRPGARFPRGVGAIGMAAAERRVVQTPNVLADPHIDLTPDVRTLVGETPYRAVLAAPLLIDEQVAGVLGILDEEGRAWDDEEVRLVEAFARQAARALVNARLYDEAQARRREAEDLAAVADATAERMRALADVQRLLSETLDLPAVANRIVQSLQQHIAATGAAVFRAGEDGASLTVIAAGGRRGPAFVGAVLPPGTGLVGRAVRERGLCTTLDTLADPDVTLTDRLRDAIGPEGRAGVAMPLFVHDRIIGALSVLDHAGRVFTEEEIALVQAFAAPAAIALENARIHGETEEQRREAEVLADVSRAINQSLDPGRVMQRVTEAARELAAADIGRTALYDPIEDAMVVRFRVGARLPGHERFAIERGRGMGGRVWELGRPLRTAHRLAGSGWTAGDLDLERAEGIVTTLVVPIRIGERVEGLLHVHNRAARPFTDAHERALLRLAEHAAVALSNARLFAAEQAARRAAEASEAALRTSEAALRHSRAVLDKALEVGRIGSWISDLGPGRRLIWSDEVCRIFGVDPASWAQSNEEFTARVHPEDRQIVRSAFERAVADRAAYTVEHRIVRDDGEVRWVYERGDIERDAAGRAVRVVGVVQDITERKQAEEALRAAEEQLRQAQKMEAIGRLAGGVAHDFNNMLSVIIGRTDVLLTVTDFLPAALRQDLDSIHRAAERAAGLTRQLLAFSRKQVLQPRVLDLNAVVAGMAPMLRRLINEDIELAVVRGCAGALVSADPGQLEQVILNLAVNARDAMPDGGRLSIETSEIEADAAFLRRHPEAGPGRYAVLTVSDSGQGMDAPTVERIFEPFFTTKEVGRGTGLGLATVYGIVRQSGGVIAVQSAPGQGATFRVYLPRVDGPGEREAARRPDVQGGSETVLVCEDEPELRALVRQVLEQRGYTVLEARNAAHALDIAAGHQGRIDLLLTDVIMPGLNGAELASRLERHPGLRVLFISGYADDVLGQRTVGTGIPLLAKPFGGAALARAVRTVLDGGQLC